MHRILNWKTLAIAVGLVVFAAVICMANGDGNAAAALFAVGALETVFGGSVLAVAAARRRARR